LQVGHGGNEQNPLKNTGSDTDSSGVQHGLPYPSRKEGNNNDNNIDKEDNNKYNKKVSALKLDTVGNDQKPSENKVPRDSKPVSNSNEPPLPDQQPEPKQDFNPEMTEQFNKILNEIKSSGITVNESLSGIDWQSKRFLVYTLNPYRPDDIMKKLGFDYVNLSRNGLLYERTFNTQVQEGDK